MSIKCMIIWAILTYIPSGFTGLDQQYEEPDHPDLIIEAGRTGIDECVQQVVKQLQSQVGYTQHIDNVVKLF